MQKFGMNALALGALVMVSLGAGGGAGCSGKKPTELVPGVSSQVVVPHDLEAVRVTVQVEGQTVFDQGYDVGANGVVELPSTLGVISGGNPGTEVTVIIRGYQQTCEESNDCTTGGNAPVGDTGAQILRRSVQTFVDQRILFLPMPLSYSCWNNNGCAADQSCKANQCVTSTTDSQTELVDFDPSLLDGTDVCFNPSQCFADAVPAQLVDLPSCTFAVPSFLAGMPGLNVRIWYQDFLWTQTGSAFANELQNGGEVEILNLDPVEGFTLGQGTVVASADAAAAAPDAAVAVATGDGGASSQELFQLAPGLCALYKQATYPPNPPTLGADGGPVGTSGTGEYVTISHIDVATGCPSKPPLLPICAGQQSNAAILPGDAGTTPDGVCNVSVTMTPTQSALYLAFDDSQVMNGAYGGTGSATALSVSLSDPVFKRTYAASTFFHQTSGGEPSSSDCTAATSSYEMPTIPFALAGTVQSKLASQLLNWTAPDPGSVSCTPSGAVDGGSTCPAGQVCAGTGTPGTYTCVTPDPLDLQAALRNDSGIYANIATFLQGKGATNVAAAMLFVNRAPTLQNDCNPPLPSPDGGTNSTVTQAIESEISAAFNGTPSMKTYFIVIDDDAHDTHAPFPNPGALTYFNQIQSDLPQAVTVLDATSTSTMSQAQIVGVNFSKIVTALGTCLYDYGLPAGDSLDQLQVSYTIPGQAKTIIPADPNCNEANQSTVSGWNTDNGRVRICGQACTTLQTGILGAAAAAMQANLPAPDIAVTATLVCAPSTTPVSDAGPVVEAGTDTGTGTSTGSFCAETCAGCCDTFGNCFTGTGSSNALACGTGGQACVACSGSETCSDTGVCEVSEGDGGTSSGSDAAMVTPVVDSGTADTSLP